MSRHFPRTRDSVCVAVDLEDKCLNNGCCPSSFFVLASAAEHVVTRYRISGVSFWSVCVGCPSCVLWALPASYPPPAHWTLKMGFGEMALMLCDHCSERAETLVCSQHFSSCKSQLCESCYRES